MPDPSLLGVLAHVEVTADDHADLVLADDAPKGTLLVLQIVANTHPADLSIDSAQFGFLGVTFDDPGGDPWSWNPGATNDETPGRDYLLSIPPRSYWPAANTDTLINLTDPTIPNGPSDTDFTGALLQVYATILRQDFSAGDTITVRFWKAPDGYLKPDTTSARTITWAGLHLVGYSDAVLSGNRGASWNYENAPSGGGPVYVAGSCLASIFHPWVTLPDPTDGSRPGTDYLLPAVWTACVFAVHAPDDATNEWTWAVDPGWVETGHFLGHWAGETAHDLGGPGIFRFFALPLGKSAGPVDVEVDGCWDSSVADAGHDKGFKVAMTQFVPLVVHFRHTIRLDSELPDFDADLSDQTAAHFNHAIRLENDEAAGDADPDADGMHFTHAIPLTSDPA